MRYLTSLLLAFLFLLNANAQPGLIDQPIQGNQSVRDFSGYTWKMKKMFPGQGIKEGIHKLPPEDIETLVWNPAHVPGDVYTDLWKAGVIEDPYFGRNSAKAQWIMYDEWWYTYQFSVKEDLRDKVVRIEFEGVDFSCDVWLNGHYLGSHEGAFSPFSFDVTDFLNASKKNLASKNILVVKLDPPPQVNSKVAGRKTPWFGDYWRDLIPFGIWRPVKMITTRKCRVTDLYANVDLEDDHKSAAVTLEIEVENTSNKEMVMQLQTTIEGKNFESKTLSDIFDVTLKPGKQLIKKTFNLKKPKLWWPWDLGDQNMYTAKVVVKNGKINHDISKTDFGIREVTMEWNPGFEKGVDVSFPRTTLINGKNHFIRSACWGGPPDIFVGRTSVDEYRKLIKLAKEANLNNIRIFGWHPPEIPEFYEICNEEGLTVWQDVVPLGTGNLPQRQSHLDSIIHEAVVVIKERRNHPSLIMIEGGEEMFLRSGDAMFTRNFLETLGDSMQCYVDLPYVPDSPLTCETAREAGYKPKEAVHALAYFYGMGRFLMEDWYQNIDYPIVPELAITSVPSVESLKKFIPKNEMWPPGLSWGYHYADLDKLLIQNWDAFGDQRTGSLEEFVNATQDAQGIIFQLSVEHFRRNKPRVSGIALCHWITYWPDMKWGIVDNYQQPKRSYNYVKTAYQPLLVNLQFNKRRWKNDEPFMGQIWIVNDLYQEYKDGTIELLMKDDSGNILQEESYDVKRIAENSSEKFIDLKVDQLKKVNQYFYFELKLKDKNDILLSENQYMLLIGDQEKASAQFKKMGEPIRERTAKYSPGNYLRYFQDMIREDGNDHHSDEENPRAIGF